MLSAAALKTLKPDDRSVSAQHSKKKTTAKKALQEGTDGKPRSGMLLGRKADSPRIWRQHLIKETLDQAG